MIQTNIKPRKSPVKRFVVAAGFFALGRTLQAASRFEPNFVKEIADWPERFTISMNVMPYGPDLVLRKENNCLQFVGLKRDPNANLLVDIKNLDTAFNMIITNLGAHDVYVRHGIGVSGNIADSMKFIRMVYWAQAYLFPGFLNTRVLKKKYPFGLKQHFNRLRFYTTGLLFGY